MTSGNVFANRKLPIKDYLLAIAIFVNAHKGSSALQLGPDLGVQYKTAFVLAHKIREANSSDIQDIKLKGEVEVDGAYFGGYVKPTNWKENRKDRRLAKNQNGKPLCVFAIRERGGRSVPVIIKSENTDAVEAAMLKHICRTSTIHADENPAYDALNGLYKVERIKIQLPIVTAIAVQMVQKVGLPDYAERKLVNITTLRVSSSTLMPTKLPTAKMFVEQIMGHCLKMC